MHSERAYYVAFSHCLGIGPHRYSLLLQKFQTAQSAYTATSQELKEDFGPVTLSNFDDFRHTYDLKQKMREIEKKNIFVTCLYEDNYPTPLKNISDPPICLYIKGRYEDFEFKDTTYIGIVGTRRASSYGMQISRKFSVELTQAGSVIVSGMALGIDTAAHTGALDAKGKTIAVLGCGVDLVYPPSNKRVYERIIREGGIVISEFPPGMTTLPGLFVARNRLISGLSAGIIVVEGLKHSGALITAKYAAEQGKDVFAPPVPLTSPLSEAPNILLKEGAKLVTSTQDVLEEYGLRIKEERRELENLSEDEKRIIDLIREEPQRLDELVITLGQPLGEVMNTITSLEISAKIEKNFEGKYQIKV